MNATQRRALGCVLRNLDCYRRWNAIRCYRLANKYWYRAVAWNCELGRLA